MLQGLLTLPEMDGQEIRPGIVLIGEPAVVAGELRCLANYYGMLAVVALKIKLTS